MCVLHQMVKDVDAFNCTIITVSTEYSFTTVFTPDVD